MLKEAGYQEKFTMIKPWLPEIIEGVKKDLRNEHLKVDRMFCKRYFLGRNPHNISALDLAAAYSQEIEEGNVGLGEFIATRWLLRHTDVYGLFEERLKKLTPDFELLNELPSEIASPLVKESVTRFGPKITYLFAVLNSVVFSEAIFASLKAAALAETDKLASENHAETEKLNLEQAEKKHAREIAALTDRFEKKFLGLQRKYLNDTDILKRQIILLQRKLQELSNG